MNRFMRTLLRLVPVVALLFGTYKAASATPTIDLIQTLCVNNSGNLAGTDNSQFIFSCRVVPSTNAVLLPLPNNATVCLIIDPTDPNNPEFGPYPANPGPLIMQPNPNVGNGWYAVVPGSAINGGSFGNIRGIRHRWSIVARDSVANSGVLMNGTLAAPKPAGNVDLYPPQNMTLMPVNANFLPDKRLTPGQLGNGLEISPANPARPNDGSGSYIYTFRVRATDPSGLPPEFDLRRETYEWRDTRGLFDTFPVFATRWNSGVTLVLIGPDGLRHYCPMEIDPSFPGQAGLQNQLYTTISLYGHPPGDIVLNINGSPLFQYPPYGNGPGVMYRYRMMGTQYVFNHGPLPGEGPFTAFGGPTQPDGLPAIPVGFGGGGDGDLAPGIELIGRPYANEYAAFAGPDRSPFAPVYPLYTDVAGRAGQWKYYFQASQDLRPPTRGGFAPNFDSSPQGFPTELYGADPDAYLYNYDSDTGLSPGDPSQPYIHPMVTPILSDGGWTDDIPENGWAYPNGQSRSAHRSRVTTKTRIRFMVRVTQPDNNNPPVGVRVFVDGADSAHGHAMQVLPTANNNDYTRGVIYYYDANFPIGAEGQHWSFFEADDGVNKVIWPRRDGQDGTGTNDPRFPDLQSFVIGPNRPDSTDFGTGIVGFNYMNEPFVNNKPQLLTPSLSPSSGVSSQPFTYSVNYYDADGDEPLTATVIIDQVTYNMSAADTNPTNFKSGGVPVGRKYTLLLNQLPPTISREHTYFFRFRDNWNNPATLGRYQISPLRREFGEFVTFPAGDDSGTPSTVITGPTITGNIPPEVNSPNVFGSDQSNTAATKYDFVAVYKDPQNLAPSTIKVYVSQDGGATFDGGTVMVPAEGSTNYAAGVQYHLPNSPTDARKQFPALSDVRYKFDVNDGVSDDVLVHVGTGPQAITDGTTHTLTALPPDLRSYQDMVLVGTLKRPTTRWAVNTPGDILVWHVTAAGVATQLTYGTDFTLDAASGTIHLTGPAFPPTDLLKISYFYSDSPGPLVGVNHPPVLSEPTPPPGDKSTNNGTLNPLQGQPTDTFTYSIIYTDADNQAPVDSQGNSNSIDLFVDSSAFRKLKPAGPPPYDYTRGVKFTISTVLGSDLGVGTHTYHFETTDGAATGRWPLATASQLELNGPTIFVLSDLKVPPFLPLFPNDKAIVPFPKGKSTDNYTFTVIYQNASGLAPKQNIEVRFTNLDGSNLQAVQMAPIDPIGPTQYTNGVRYQVQLTAPAPPLTIGAHKVSFGFTGSAPSVPNPPLVLTVNGAPVLTNPLPASGKTYSQAANVPFSVTYTDPNNDTPAFVRVIVDPGPNQQLMALAPDPAATKPYDYTSGVTFVGQFGLKGVAIGPHTFHFTANDGTEDSATVPVPDAGFNVIAALPPTLSAPGGDSSNLNGLLTPLQGAQSATYTYSVKYTHPQNVAPTTIQVLIDAGGANPIALNMKPTDPNPNYANGEVFTGVTQPNQLSPGPHTFSFTASDQINTATLFASTSPNVPFNGPTINNPPVLSAGGVEVQGATAFTPVNGQNVVTPTVQTSIFGKLVFQVTYADPDNVGPGATGYVRVVVDATATPPIVIPMTLVAGQSATYKSGLLYQSAATSLPAGTHTFHFEANDGFDPARLPATGEASGITINNVPVLSAPASGITLSPTTGPLSTNFTYTVVYTHGDNLAPQSIQVVIDNVGFNMVQAASQTNTFAQGVTYTFAHRFAAGSTHTYRFTAMDSVNGGYTAQYPVDGTTLNGPTINIASFSQPTFVPTPGIAGSNLTLTSQLNAGASSNNQAVAITIVKPDGTGFNASGTTSSTGALTYSFVPDQTGTYKVRLAWAGVANTSDPITNEFTFTVKGYTLNLSANVLDMVASPLIPVTPDPGISFGVTDGAGNPLPITTLNLIKWDPTFLPNGKYAILNSDPTFPGVTGGAAYWVNPSQAVTLNPRGKLWDQTMPYALSLSPGWNMIGSVFQADINWSAVKVIYQGQTYNMQDASNFVRPVAWGYDASAGSYFMIQSGSGVMKPGRGVWVHALVPCQLLLNIPGARAAQITRDAIDTSATLQVVARSGSIMDKDNYIPMTGVTTRGAEIAQKPPYMGHYVSVKIMTSDTVQLPDAVRSAAIGQTVSGFQVSTDQKNKDVIVQFPNLATLGRKYDITLVDLASNATRSLGSISSYTFNSGDATAPRRFAILVAATSGTSSIRITDMRSNGRGPAGAEFTFNLSHAASVKAQILGSTGTVLRELATGRAAVLGLNTMVWDGKNNQGTAVPAGTYLLRINAVDDKGHAATAVLPVTLVR